MLASVCILRLARSLCCRAVLLALAVLGIGISASANVVYVNKSAYGALHDGTSWSTAFTAIQPAINSSKSGDEVWVAAGLYVERIVLKASVGLYGGFAGSETDRSQRDWHSHTSTLDGNQGGSTVTINAPAAASTILDGFTIRDGTGTPSSDGYDRGGGIYCSRSAPTIRNNIITRNESYFGGGIACVGGSPTITNNFLFDNSGGGYGGAIYGDGSALNVRSNFIVANGSFFAAVYLTSYSVTTPVAVTIVNNSIVANTSYGVNLGEKGTAVFANNLLAFNDLTGSYSASGLTIAARTNDYFGNGDGNAGLGPFQPGQNGNISVDPNLNHPGQVDAHISLTSPLRDAGDSSFVSAGELDIDGNPRLLDNAVDIGADEAGDGAAQIIVSHPHLVFVSTSGNDLNEGASWGTAKRTVQAGIDAAEGGEVWVASGVYVHRIWLGCYTKLFGGFSGTERDRGARNAAVNVTVLDGAHAGTVVFTPGGRDANVIDGFTIRNGSGHLDLSSVTWAEGGGVYTGSSSPTISNNVITANRTRSMGGGIYSAGPKVVITGNIIDGNFATDVYDDQWGGGGVYLFDSKGLVANNIIRNNQAAVGAGIMTGSGYGSAAIRNNLIAGNRGSSADYGGGGMFVHDRVSAANNTFVKNTAPRGGAISDRPIYGAFSGVNNIIALNSSGLYVVGASDSATLSQTCFFGNTAYDDSRSPGSIGQKGNFAGDPQFALSAKENYHLRSRSPCIDRGDDTAVVPGQVDLDGIPRIMGKHVDIGCFEYSKLSVFPTNGITENQDASGL